MYTLCMNVRDKKPMRYVEGLSNIPESLTEADRARAFEAVIGIVNSFPRDDGTQYAIVEDGLIVAVEGLTTRKLIWTN